METASSPAPREVILGSSSKVWQQLQALPGIAARFGQALGHRDLPQFAFTPNDRVWLFSYSRVPQDNSAMVARLKAAGVREVVYLSSSSVIVEQRTRCWEYPRVKAAAQAEVAALPHGRVLTVGLVYGQPDELPSGPQMTTSHAELAAFMLAPDWPEGGRAKHLLRAVERPWRHALDAPLHALYGALQTLCGPWPCLLRPLDLALRTLGLRWYGYTYLSTRLWMRKTSS
jgi:hypothetical protein